MIVKLTTGCQYSQSVAFLDIPENMSEEDKAQEAWDYALQDVEPYGIIEEATEDDLYDYGASDEEIAQWKEEHGIIEEEADD